MWQRVSSLKDALEMVRNWKVAGKANLFRGQTRTWPMLSSFIRKDPRERQAAMERWAAFYNWMQSVPALIQLAQDDDKVLAIGQHYGLATNLVDFTTEPKVAAFFASHTPPPPSDGKDESCIICLNYDELKDVSELVMITRPNMPQPRLITLDIPDLWRIQSQRGVFLEYPYDIGFEREIFGYDRIVFPTERNPAILEGLISLQDIYPTQKSDLEILLDQFFMLERMEKGSEEMHEIARRGNIRIIQQPVIPDGIEAECFGDTGLPMHESWEPSRLTAWLRPPREDWQPISAVPRISIPYPHDGTSREKIQILYRSVLDSLAGEPEIRNGPVRWELASLTGCAPETVRAVELTWDGLRRWPYETSEIAQGLATVIVYAHLVAQQPNACHEPQLAHALAEQCIGEALRVEIGHEDNSYTQGYANRELMRQAVREDFDTFLTDYWRPRITDIRHILQIAFNPRRALVFERLKTVFATQIVPTQVVLRGEASGKARLYNLARAITLGLP